MRKKTPCSLTFGLKQQYTHDCEKEHAMFTDFWSSTAIHSCDSVRKDHPMVTSDFLQQHQNHGLQRLFHHVYAPLHSSDGGSSPPLVNCFERGNHNHNHHSYNHQSTATTTITTATMKASLTTATQPPQLQPPLPYHHSHNHLSHN